MSTLFGSGKRADLSSLSQVNNGYIRIGMAAGWVVTFDGVALNNSNQGGASEVKQGSSNDTMFGSGDILTIGVDGASNDVWNPTNLPASSYGFFRVFGDVVSNQSFTLFADENGANEQPQDIDYVAIYSSDNSTIIHYFDLTAPSSATITDDEGNGGILTLVGFSFGPSLDDVGGNDTVVVGDTEAITYSNFTTPIETATINDGGTATTNLTVSSAGSTSANIQLASLPAWVNTKACPFSSTNQTSQQVTVTNTDEAESASRAVTFNPPSGYTVIETNSMTWPAPDGSILKGFASQPPANSQVIHPNGLTVTAAGIVSTDLTTNQTCYFYNETTEEGSSFQFLIQSIVSNSNNSVDSPVRDTIRSIIRNPVR